MIDDCIMAKERGKVDWKTKYYMKYQFSDGTSAIKYITEIN